MLVFSSSILAWLSFFCKDGCSLVFLSYRRFILLASTTLFSVVSAVFVAPVGVAWIFWSTIDDLDSLFLTMTIADWSAFDSSFLAISLGFYSVVVDTGSIFSWSAWFMLGSLSLKFKGGKNNRPPYMGLVLLTFEIRSLIFFSS